MQSEPRSRIVPSNLYEPKRSPTPDSATWDVHEDAEVELLGDLEHVDFVDIIDENWAPGQPAPGLPADEVLHIHSMTDREPSADELDVSDLAHDRLELASDELFEGEDDR